MSIAGNLEMERYNESMFERQANGLPTMSFAEWRKEQARLDQLFADLQKERQELRNRELGRQDAQAFGYKTPRDDVEAEEQMESEFFDRKS